MRIKDLYCTVLSIVCRVTDLEENEIFCSNKEECVDARSLLIKTLIDNGITEKEIVRLTGLSQQRVDSLKNNFKYRIGKYHYNPNIEKYFLLLCILFQRSP